MQALDKHEIKGLEKRVTATRSMWNFQVMGRSRKCGFRERHRRNSVENRHVSLRILVILESGDCSVITRWTVDQEVVGSDQTDSRNNILCHARTLSRFTPAIR